MILLGSLLSGLSDILLVVGSIAWAIFQYQTVSRLTFVPQEILINSHSLKSKPLRFFYILRLIWNWFSHITMYLTFRPPCEGSILQLVIISSLPLTIPYDFYSKRPILATFCLMCWGQLWLKDMYLGLIFPFALSIPFFLPRIIIPLHIAELVERACWAPDGQEWKYFRDNFYAKVVVRSSREIWRAIWMFWPLPTVQLEPFHQQSDYHYERASDLKQRQHSTSEALDETKV